jgi:SpoVK/Ycf46/Vps4 family AAA+-type ATPase
MPLRFEIRQPVLLIVSEGDTEYNEGLEQIKLALQEARRHGPEALLWDLIFDVTESTGRRGESDARGVAMALAQHKHMLTGRMAVVVGGAQHAQLVRSSGVFAEQLRHEPRMFDKLPDAEAWLKAERAKP